MRLRQNHLEALARESFDVLIVGGGINGAVSAASLAVQGARVALVDAGDFGGLTSQESSNLIWGGIKYLESGELPLVAKLCGSRNRLLDTYPSSVREIRFFTTVARGFRRSRATLFAGACLYWLVGEARTRAPRLLSASEIASEEPVIDAASSIGGFEYSDAYLVDNDARFVFGFVRSAIEHGASVANYVRATSSEPEGEGAGRGWLTRLEDALTGNTLAVRSRVLINACGPLVDAYNQDCRQPTRHHHVFSKGVHLIVDRITESRRVLTFFADDGRMFFVIPLGNKSCLGTTDTRVAGLPALVTPEDRRFILENVNKRLRLARPLSEGDIIAERCGVRPLVVEREQDVSEGFLTLSRKHAVEVDAARRYLSVFGGKLTDCLNVGEEVAAAAQELGVELPDSGMRFYGEPPDEMRDRYFHQARLMRLDALTAKESSELLSTRLWRRYGASAFGLLEDIRQDARMAEVLIVGTEYIRCELHYAARCEMVTKLEDFLRRRSKIALLGRKQVVARAPGLREACAILFGQEADAKYDEYFAELAHRESLVPLPEPEVRAG